MTKHNPYYKPEKLGLTLFSLDEANMCWEFNTFCVWITPDKQLYTASDSGCSCPTPFENYESATLDEFKQQTERHPDVQSVMDAAISWNNSIHNFENRCNQSELNRLESNIKEALN